MSRLGDIVRRSTIPFMAGVAAAAAIAFLGGLCYSRNHDEIAKELKELRETNSIQATYIDKLEECKEKDERIQALLEGKLAEAEGYSNLQSQYIEELKKRLGMLEENRALQEQYIKDLEKLKKAWETLSEIRAAQAASEAEAKEAEPKRRKPYDGLVPLPEPFDPANKPAEPVPVH